MAILSIQWHTYRSINDIYQGGPIDHGTHVTIPVSQSSTEIEYNAACTTGTNLSILRILINELFNKYPDIVPEEAPLIILYSKFSVCMAKNGKYIKDTRHISRITCLVRNGENCKMHKIDWCEGGYQGGPIHHVTHVPGPVSQ